MFFNRAAMGLRSLLGVLALVDLAHAQYFSAGWTPGQPVPTESVVQPTPTPVFDTAGPATSFLDTLISPVSTLASLLGLNISTTQDHGWDKRVPLITDSNYVDVVVNEELTAEEEEERLWFLVM